jgi:trimeric autotransporter adhesin
MAKPCSLFLCLLAGTLFGSTASLAQSATASPRITSEIQESSLTRLTGSVPLLAKAQYDRGEAAASTQLTHMRLVLTRTAEQDAALDTYLSQLQDKSSPNYHKWLTPTQFGELYGPASSDLSALVAWLESHGLKVEAISPGRTNISFAGTVGQVEGAFHTPIHSFAFGGQQFLSNTADPQIPTAITSVVKGIAHLSTFKARPLGVRGRPGMSDPDSGVLAPIQSTSALASSPRAQETVTSSSKYYLYMVPGDAATIYNTPNTTFNANYTSGTSYTGSGVTIGIGGDAAIITTPVVNFRSLFLGDSTAPTITNVDGVTSTTDADEAYLDIEISGGIAPGAKVHYYPSSDLYSGIDQAINENIVDIFSLSFGACELGYTTSDNLQIQSWWKQAAAQGIAVTVSSGDNGSAACDDPSSETKAEYGLQVNGLGSTAYNISVGGTDFALSQSNFTTYAATSDSSTTYYRTAKSYIPETTWNDSTSVNTTLSLNVPYTSTSANIYAGSGGKSNCATNTNTASTLGSCTTGWTKPSWQRGTGVPSDSVRDLPDISLMSGDGANYAAWLVCTNDTSNGTTANCATTNGSFYFYGFGGTSTASPAFAGVLALVQQSQGGGRLGQAAANLYNLYNNSSSASSIFHDITTGNISVPCDSTSTYGDCSKNTAGNYYLTGYDTSAGYDLATGLGSVNVANLIANWSSGLGSNSATVTVTSASTAITTSNSLNVTVTVTGTAGTPSGSIVLSGGGYTSSSISLNSGAATFTIAAGALATGSDTLTATYSGDGLYSTAYGVTTVAVTTASLTATTTTVAASPTSTTYGTSVALTATVSPSAATGTVTFFYGSTQLGTGTLSSGTATLATTTLPIGTDSITAVYAGDTSYASSTSSAVTVTVSASSSSGSGSGGTGTSTATVTPSGGYTGTVDFSLYATSTYLINYACYDINSATVSGTATASSTLTLYLGTDNCSSSAIQSGKVHAFKTAKTSKIASIPAAPITPVAGVSFGLLFAGLLGWRFRKARAYFSVLAIVALGFALSGCGGGSSSSATKGFVVSLSPSTLSLSAGTSGIPTGTYSMTVEGDDSANSNYTSSATLTLTVK